MKRTINSHFDKLYRIFFRKYALFVETGLAFFSGLCYIVFTIKEGYLAVQKPPSRSEKQEVLQMKHLGLFAAGVLFGTAGLKILGSKDAKKVYAHTTAAVLRAKDCIMKAATTVREGAEDVYADAKDINEARLAAQEAAVVEDASEAEAPAAE